MPRGCSAALQGLQHDCAQQSGEISSPVEASNMRRTGGWRQPLEECVEKAHQLRRRI
jgi:hypothetical protein